jgi:hypothetical protein
MLLDSLTVSMSEQILFQKVDGGVVLLNAVNGEYYGLNEIGTRIWELLQEGQSAVSVVACLLQEYNVSEQQLRQDVGKFLGYLQSRGLVEVREQNAG